MFKNRLVFLFACCSAIIITSCSGVGVDPDEYPWEEELWFEDFDTTVFESAKNQDKLVLLDIYASWCHWCHVMDDSTYQDSSVVSYLNEHFIVCTANADNRPDLYATYRNYGWPATIVFDQDRNELLKLRGFIPPKRFLKELKAVVKNPKPLSEREIAQLPFEDSDIDSAKAFWIRNLDYELGGYKEKKKQIHAEGFEYAVQLARENDRVKDWLELTFENSLNIHDPVWGGVYQYSDKSVWTSPHYEKLLKNQADYISAYIRYYFNGADIRAHGAIIDIKDFCEYHLESMSYDHLFNNSHSASDPEFYELDEEGRDDSDLYPDVDYESYLKENAMMCIAYFDQWCVYHDDELLEQGEEMIKAFLAIYHLHSGLYTRISGEAEVLSLDDNRLMLEALLTAYECTGKSSYLSKAKALAHMMIREFKSDDDLFLAASGDLIVPAPSPINSNLEMVRLLDRVGHLSEDAGLIKTARSVYSKIDKKRVINKMWGAPLLLNTFEAISNDAYKAIILYDGEMTNETIGNIAFIRFNCGEKIIPVPTDLNNLKGEDKTFYGDFPAGTIFMCTSSYCSPPISSPKELERFAKDEKAP